MVGTESESRIRDMARRQANGQNQELRIRGSEEARDQGWTGSRPSTAAGMECND